MRLVFRLSRFQPRFQPRVEMKRPSTEISEAVQVEWTDDLVVEFTPDGKKAGTKSYDRYQKYSVAKTVGEARKLGASKADLQWDYEKKLVQVSGDVQAKAKKGTPPPVSEVCSGESTFHAVKHFAAATSLCHGVRLASGTVLPAVGFGTYTMKKGEAAPLVAEALKLGYRLIDTAQIYENEGDVGIAMRESGVPRSELFIETKHWRSSHGFERTLKACNQSLKKLGTSYIDLYVIHWPGAKTGWPLPRGQVSPPDWTPAMRDTGTWRAMEQLYDEGKVRAIGVTNYSLRHLQQLLKTCRIKPMVNQVEFHPRLVQSDLLKFCQKEGIALQAYASLGSSDAKAKAGEFLQFEPVVLAAKAHGVSPAQVLLRWALEKGCGVIPKSTKAHRMEENAKIFDFQLSSEEVAAIDSLHTGQRFAWKGLDPDTIE